MTSDQNNLVSINIARGLAALSVFIFHYHVGLELAKHTGITFLRGLDLPGALYGAAFFFMISGFCIHGAEWRRVQKDKALTFHLGAYAERRFRRIYPLYFFALLLSCGLAGLQGNWPSWPDVGLHLLLLHGFSPAFFNTLNVVLWSIAIEACFYTIYPVWLSYRLRAGFARAFFVGIGCSLLSCMITAAFFYPYNMPERWFFLNTWCGWLFGAALAETIPTKSAYYSSWKWWLPGFLFAAFCLWAETENFYECRRLILLFPFRILLCAWPLSALVLSEPWLATSEGIVRKIIQGFSWIGLCSYSLYLLHTPLIEIRELLEAHLPSGGFRLIFQAAGFFIILAASWWTYQHIELRFMKRSYKNKSSREEPSPHPLS